MTIDDRAIARIPPAVEAIGRDSTAIGFTMASEPKTGSLLRTLAASLKTVFNLKSAIYN